MTIKIIPITPEYREGWEKTFGKKGKVVLIAERLKMEAEKRFCDDVDRVFLGLEITNG